MTHAASPDDRSRFRPAVLFAGLFMALCLVASGVATTVRGDGEFTFYFAVLLGIAVAVGLIHLRVNFSAPLLWGLVSWAALHMAGGLVPVPESWPINGEQRVLYSWWLWPDADSPYGGWLKYDHVIHAYGFGVTTWACWQALRSSVRAAGATTVKPTVGRLVLCGAAGMGFGALNEVVEFIATLMGPTNVGGYVNTGYDLIANLAGCVIAGVAIRLFGRR